MNKPLPSDNFNLVDSHSLKSGDNGIAKVQSLDISEIILFQVVCQSQKKI